MRSAAPIKVLMVCLGNICRSPMAQGILEYHAAKQNIPMWVDSAGTASYHVGEPPHPRSIEVCRKRGIDITSQRARQFRPEDLQQFDYIMAMDLENYADILAHVLPGSSVKNVVLATHWLYPGQQVPVPDPYYGTIQDYVKVFELLDQSMYKFTQYLLHEY